MPNRPPVALSKGRGGGFSINSRLGIRSCNSSLSKGPLSPGLVPLAILAGGEGSGRHSYAWKVFQTEIVNMITRKDEKLVEHGKNKAFAFDLSNVYTTMQHLMDLECELLQTRFRTGPK